MPGWLVLGNPSEKGKVMDKITRIGVDLAKNVIQVHGVDSMERVLQIQQPRNQAWRSRRSAFARHEALAHRRPQSLPVDQIGQADQGMLHVDLFSQRMPEETSFRHRRLLTHLHLVEKCRILALMCQVPANLTTPFRHQSLIAQGFDDCSGATN
jgi:hypothetical protein